MPSRTPDRYIPDGHYTVHVNINDIRAWGKKAAIACREDPTIDIPPDWPNRLKNHPNLLLALSILKEGLIYIRRNPHFSQNDLNVLRKDIESKLAPYDPSPENKYPKTEILLMALEKVTGRPNRVKQFIQIILFPLSSDWADLQGRSLMVSATNTQLPERLFMNYPPQLNGNNHDDSAASLTFTTFHGIVHTPLSTARW